MRFGPTDEQRARIEAAMGPCEFFERYTETEGVVQRLTVGVHAFTAEGRPREAQYECAPFEVKMAWNLIADACEERPRR